MKNLAALISIAGLISGIYFLKSDTEAMFKREILSVNLIGKPVVKKVDTLASPVLTPMTIGENIKKKIVIIEAMDLSDVDGYINKVRPMFTKEYFKTEEKDLRVKAQFFIDHLVRIKEFIVTKQPIYIGSKTGDVPNWIFYLEGVYGNRGFGSKDKFGALNIYVTVQEAKSSDGNPIGVEISNITELN
ncbi:hypothetical protein [Photobacterium kishitanii]|uniref:Uncharacterized protein n=1 Tax=Photobacterium kishitanii TaxID=318456 RepID=A0A2T3KN27_9GAMM|nr:hypothetical protein [Photobacterium kishitanii]PSV01201.1 hypothetical protein C9J27_04025 [Photobacterium kishitanii]